MGSEIGISSSDPRIAGLLAEAERRWGRGSLMRLGDAAAQAEVEVIPTGFPTLDEALGIGGLPCGRISEIFGPDSSGKQALAAHLAVQCQRAEGVVAYLDMGRRLDPEQMRAQGVDFQSLLVARPGDPLQGLEMAIRLARSGGIQLIIFDLQRVWDRERGRRGDGETRNVGPAGTLAPTGSSRRGAGLSLALRRLVSAVDRNGIAFVFLTEAAISYQLSAISPQLSAISYQPSGRRTQDAGLGTQSSALSPQSSMGRQALRFFASVRLGVERREWIRRGRDVMGCRSTIQVAKNKLAPPLKEAEVELFFYRFPPHAPVLHVLPRSELGSTEDRLSLSV